MIDSKEIGFSRNRPEAIKTTADHCNFWAAKMAVQNDAECGQGLYPVRSSESSIVTFIRSVLSLFTIVRGSGLESLLADVAAQRVALIREPSRSDRFSAGGAQFIREIVVQKVEAEAYGR